MVPLASVRLAHSRYDPKTGEWAMEKAPVYHIMPREIRAPRSRSGLSFLLGVHYRKALR